MLEGLADRNRSEGLLDADAEVGDPGVPLAPVSQLPGVPGLRDHRLSRRGDAPPAGSSSTCSPWRFFGPEPAPAAPFAATGSALAGMTQLRQQLPGGIEQLEVMAKQCGT